MPNWERTPPKSGMSIEEIKRRVEAGIKRRRQTGELRPLTKPLTTTVQGPSFTKEQRRMVIAATNLAIYSLAQIQRADFCDAIDAINAVRREAGHLGTNFMEVMCHGIATEAAALAGERVADLDTLARTWLAKHYAPSGRVVSIPKSEAKTDADRTEKKNGQVH